MTVWWLLSQMMRTTRYFDYPQEHPSAVALYPVVVHRCGIYMTCLSICREHKTRDFGQTIESKETENIIHYGWKREADIEDYFKRRRQLLAVLLVG